MEVKQIMSRSVHSCRPADKLSDAAQLMWDKDCGCIPVLSDDGSNEVVGVITDRDICMASHLRGKPPSEIEVGDAMSTPVRKIISTAKLAEAERMMREAQVRRLPVVDREGQLVGILALADLAREAERMRSSGHSEINEFEVGLTLSAISQSRTPSALAASA